MHEYSKKHFENIDSIVEIKLDWRFFTLFEYFLRSIKNSYIKLEFYNMHDVHDYLPIISEFTIKTSDDIETFLKYFSSSYLHSTIKILIYNDNFENNPVIIDYKSPDCNNSKIKLNISTLNLMLLSIITELTDKSSNYLNTNYVSCDIRYVVSPKNSNNGSSRTFHFSKYITSPMPFILFSNKLEEVQNSENIYECNLFFNYPNIIRIILILNIDLHKDLRLTIDFEKKISFEEL